MNGNADLRSALREELDGRLRRSPMDFIRVMDLAGDRRMWLRELTRPLPEELDLLTVAPIEGGSRVAVFAEILPWDTEFFGFTVARVNAMIHLADPGYQVLADLGQAVAALIEVCKSRSVEYLFAPVDMRDVAVVRALSGKGFEVIESRLYAHRSLKDFKPRERYDVRLATQGDIEPLSEVAATMINPYDRFHADPLLHGEPADRMMREWVRASIQDGFADGTIVPNVPRPGAFLTIKHHRERWQGWGLALGQAPFGAVSLAFKGWYVKLISEICCHLQELGAEHFFMVSQATNNAVVRCWEKLGFHYGKNELILRLWLGRDGGRSSPDGSGSGTGEEEG